MKKINYFLIMLFALVITSCSDDTELPKSTSIVQIAPKVLNPGQDITITGTDLNNNPSFVLNGKNIKPSVITNTVIKLKIPIDASSGKLKIEFSQINNTGKSSYKEFLKVLDNGWVKNNNTPLFTKMEFANDNVAYATNQDNALQKRKLYKTTDEGKTWHVILETTVSHFNFYVGDSKVILAKGSGNVYKKSIDGGTTWKDIKLLDQKYIIKDIAFLNKDEGFLFTNNSTKSWIFKTTDGGENWIQVKEFNKNYASGEFVYSKDSYVYLYDHSSDELILTKNKGTNWEVKKVSVNLFRPKVDFKDHDTAWFGDIGISKGKTIYKTTDSGKTLIKKSELNLNTKEEIIGFNFLSNDKGHVITNKGASFYTLDGGKTWKSFYLDKQILVSNVFYYKNKILVFSNGILHEKTL